MREIKREIGRYSRGTHIHLDKLTNLHKYLNKHDTDGQTHELTYSISVVCYLPTASDRLGRDVSTSSGSSRQGGYKQSPYPGRVALDWATVPPGLGGTMVPPAIGDGGGDGGGGTSLSRAWHSE